MKKIVRSLGILLGFITVGHTSQASLQNIESLDLDNDKEEYFLTNDELSLACNILISLELEPYLSMYQKKVNQLVWEMVEQVAKEPIQYCGEFEMAQVVERDPELL